MNKEFEVAGIVKNIPEFRNILIKDCVCTGGNIGVVLHGLTGRASTVHNITVKNCDFATKQKIDLLDCENVQII